MIPPQRKDGARRFCSMSVTRRGKSVGQVLVPGPSYQTFANEPFYLTITDAGRWRSKVDRAQTVARPAGRRRPHPSARSWAERPLIGLDSQAKTLKPVLGSRLINIAQIRLGMGPKPRSRQACPIPPAPCVPQTPGRPRPQLPRRGSPWRWPVRVAPGEVIAALDRGEKYRIQEAGAPVLVVSGLGADARHHEFVCCAKKPAFSEGMRAKGPAALGGGGAHRGLRQAHPRRYMAHWRGWRSATHRAAAGASGVG
jgi:hypothetical protein